MKRTPVIRGIFVALVIWGALAYSTREWGGCFQGFLRYDPRYAGYFRLIEAIEANDLIKVKQELKTTSPDLHPPFWDDQDYVHPLFCAVRSNNQAMVRLLLDQGAYPKKGDLWENSALTRAALDDNGPMMELLLAHRTPDREALDNMLWMVAEQGKRTGVKILLAHGAKPSQSSGSQTLSQWVVEAGHPETAALLEKASKGKH